MLAKLYDEHAAIVLGFLEKLSNDKDKAEELLQAVFLALPAQLHEFDAGKGRFVVWLLKLARTMAGQPVDQADFKTNGANLTINTPIHSEPSNVHSPNTSNAPARSYSRPLTVGKEKSVVELLYVKGYTFTESADELGVDESTIRILVRTELKKYRRY